MTDFTNDMIALIHQTKAVSIWDRKNGPVFWYAAGVPGPFYVNTELVIGPALSKTLLDSITAIIATTPQSAVRADKLNKLILSAYQDNASFQNIITALAAKIKIEFPLGSFDVISGGERRDWLFSIPLAHALGIRHVFLFKDKSFYCSTPLTPGEKTLHIADLINNAASYFDSWFPILAQAKLSYIGTACVNTRGTNGVQRLLTHGQKVVALNAIDIAFFKRSYESGLIDQETVDEIALYFRSPQEWAQTYLLKNPLIFDTLKIDAKSFERLQDFFSKDPWALRAAHQDFFEAMANTIAARRAKS